VFVLAVYLVYETVSFILLDSLEAIDSDRVARVFDCFRTRTDYLVAALLLKDDATLPDECACIESIN